MEQGLVGVAGLGTMGRNIARLVAQAGFQLRAVEEDQEALAWGLQKVREGLEKVLNKGQDPEKGMKEVLDRIFGRTEMVAIPFRDCLLVVEAVLEGLEFKKRVFSELERLCAPEAVLASNTSPPSG